MVYKKMVFGVVLLLLIYAPAAKAVKYRVARLSPNEIRIGDRIAQIGMEFEDNEPIFWSTDNQGLEVINLENRKLYTISSNKFADRRPRSLIDHFQKSVRLSTREWGTTTVTVDTVRYMMTELYIDAGRDYGNDVIDEVVVSADGKTIVTRLRKTSDKKEFIITRDMLGVGNGSQTVYLDIVETDKGWKYYIYRKLRIDVLPLRN